MHDKLSFHNRSEDDVSAVIAAEAQRIVREAAAPVLPGEGIKAQMRKAWATLGRPPWWRVRAAWYGEAGTWSAAALEELRARYKNWKSHQEAIGRLEADIARKSVLALREEFAEAGALMDRKTADALERAVGDMGGPVGSLAVRKD